MADNPADGGAGNAAAAAAAAQDPSKKAGATVHVREDSDSALKELFAVVQNPGSSSTPLSVPFRLRNLPPSFFNPPSPKSPIHSREGSTVSNHEGNSLNDPFSPAPKSVGSPQPPLGQQQQQVPAPNHTRSQSAPVDIGTTHVTATQQHVHLRQPSYDAGGAAANNGMGPLPPGWEPARTPTGQLYFMNHITKTTQWEDPRVQMQQQQQQNRQQQQQNAQQQRASPQPQPPTHQQPLQAQQQQAANNGNLGPLPQGWEQSVTPDGEVYFINHITKSTSWFDPRLPVHNQTVPIRQQQQQQQPGQMVAAQQQAQLVQAQMGQQQQQQQLAPGMTAAQKRQQDIRLQRLENERRVLQQRQQELKRFMADKQEHLRQSNNLHTQERMQSALNATQEMLMRQNLNDNPASQAATNAQQQQVAAGMDPFLSTAQQPGNDQLHQHPIHSKQESADSGLGMGSNFNLGPIPEDDMSMDTTDLDTTLTENTNSGGGGSGGGGGGAVAQGSTVLMTSQPGQQPGQQPGGGVVDEQLISNLPAEMPNLGDDNELMLNDILDSRQAQWI